MYSNQTNLTSLVNFTANYQSRVVDNCPDTIMSAQTFYDVERVVSCGVVPPCFLIGTVTNILSMIVFYRQGLRDRMNLCLFCLAFVDLMYITAVLVVDAGCLASLFLSNQDQRWRGPLVVHSLNFMYGFAYSSGCLTMIIAVERCVCVMFPMKAATLISTKTMAIILVLTLLFIQVLCSVYAFKHKILTFRDEVTGVYISLPVYTDLYLTYSIFGIIENIVLACISFCTFTCVFLATVTTVIRLHTAQIWRKSTASSHMKGQGMLMRMLVAMSCVYILCTAPNVALSLARFTVPEFRANGSFCNIFSCLHMMGYVIYMFHSSINFFVYIAMSSRFRQDLTAMSCYSKFFKARYRSTKTVSLLSYGYQ